MARFKSISNTEHSEHLAFQISNEPFMAPRAFSEQELFPLSAQRAVDPFLKPPDAVYRLGIYDKLHHFSLPCFRILSYRGEHSASGSVSSYGIWVEIAVQLRRICGSRHRSKDVFGRVIFGRGVMPTRTVQISVFGIYGIKTGQHLVSDYTYTRYKMVTKAIFRDGRYFDFDFELICVHTIYVIVHGSMIDKY